MCQALLQVELLHCILHYITCDRCLLELCGVLARVLDTKGTKMKKSPVFLELTSQCAERGNTFQKYK